jgi:hypothetical protein
LGAIASSSYVLRLYDGLRNIILFFRRPANKRKSKKMISSRSALLVNPTTSKISIEKTNRIQGRRSRIPNLKLKSMFEIPKDSLNDSPM